MKKVLQFLAILIYALWFTGCATVRTPEGQNQNISWDSRAQTLSNIKSWDLKALIAIRTPKDSASATMQWQQQQQNYTLLLFGPLGTNSATLTGDASKVTLVTSDGKKAEASSPEALLKQQFGWDLPVSHLYYWIRGLPVPNLPSQTQFDEYHHLTVLIQQDWRIEFSRYMSVKNIDLPNKIVINNSQLNVKIIVKEWR